MESSLPLAALLAALAAAAVVALPRARKAGRRRAPVNRKTTDAAYAGGGCSRGVRDRGCDPSATTECNGGSDD